MTYIFVGIDHGQINLIYSQGHRTCIDSGFEAMSLYERTNGVSNFV